MYIEYTLKYQNETFLLNQEWSGIFIAKYGEIHIESSILYIEFNILNVDCWMLAIRCSIKYQNETFLINQEYSGIFISNQNMVQYILKVVHWMYYIESSILNVAYWM